MNGWKEQFRFDAVDAEGKYYPIIYSFHYVNGSVDSRRLETLQRDTVNITEDGYEVVDVFGTKLTSTDPRAVRE